MECILDDGDTFWQSRPESHDINGIAAIVHDHNGFGFGGTLPNRSSTSMHKVWGSISQNTGFAFR